MNYNKQNLLKQINDNPNDYNINLQLGLAYVIDKDYLNAKIIFEKLILINKNKFEGYLNLSNIYNLLNEQKKSVDVLKDFLKKNKYNKEIISGLSTLYYNYKEYKKLEQLIIQYIDLEDNHLLFFFKAFLSEKNNQIKEGLDFLYKCIRVNNRFWPAYEKLFVILEKQNEINKINEILDQSKEIFYNDIKFIYYKALYLHRVSDDESALKIIQSEKLLEKFKKSSNLNYLINTYDLLSKIYTKINEYSLSLEYAIKRNVLTLNKKENKKFDKNILFDIIKKYKFFYDKNDNNINIIQNNNCGDNLVFLVGFPRSGTTLLDTILRSHSKTMVLEEKPYLINIRHKFFKNNTLDKINSISENEIVNLQKIYFDSFDYNKHKITIDKFPLNLIELGFIKKIFPKSKIILALRHPLDSILSCVLTSFKINEAMANYENLQSTSYFYNEVFSLFEIYKKSLNLDLFTIKYENIVNNFESEIKNLLFFLNINYEDSVKNYHLTAKKREFINTPSYHQVIKPIYKDALARYKKYPETEEVKHIIFKWIQAFDY